MHHPTRLLALSILIYLSTTANGADDFPKLRDIASSFETNVEMTDLVQETTVLANEYYDFEDRIGRVDILATGKRMSVYYNETEDQVFTVTDTSCVEDLGGIFETDLIEGWINKEKPLYAGPSALILMAQSRSGDVVKLEGDSVRSFRCDHYQLKTSRKGKNRTIDYYFVDSKWTMPFGSSGKRYPIRITQNSDTELLDQIIDYQYFRPNFNDKSKYQPPVGLGCWGKSPIVDLPKIPPKYTFGAEGFDLFHDEKHSETDVKLYRLWYDSKVKAARLDKYTEDGMISDLDDFETGVQYHVHDSKTCTFRPLRKSIFLSFQPDSLVEKMKEPAEVLQLQGDFYSLGEAELRGVKSRVFEKAEKDVEFRDQKYALLVTTVYFSSQTTKSEVDGEDITVTPPLEILITGYGPDDKLILKKQFQIFSFNDEPGREFFETFPVGACFPTSSQKSYFVIMLDADPEIAAKVEAISPAFLTQAKGIIINVANITHLRLPFLKVDYRIEGITLTGLMLDKPPSLAQFVKEFDYPILVKSTAAFKIEFEADTEESCATACVSLSEPCKGFHFCGSGGCLLDIGEIIDEQVSPMPLDLKCYIYIRAESDSKNSQDTLEKALKNLVDAKDKGKLSFPALIPGDSLRFPAVEVVTSLGSDGESVTDYPYNLVKDGFQFKSEEDVETTVDIVDASSEEECYRYCKEATTIACASFSYCAKASNKMCRITSVLLGRGTKDYEEIDANPECDIFSLLYLDFFERYPGKVFTVLGEKSVDNVLSTEECAKTCKEEKDFKCRGFEYCRSKRSCVLHSKHVLDLKSAAPVPQKKFECVHYAAKFVADYRDLGFILIDDNSRVRGEITLEECARACSEEVSNCNSFNYCPPSSVGMVDSSCAFISKTIFDDDVKTITKGKCHHYSKRENIEDWNVPKPSSEKQSGGYTSKGFAGLLVGMIVLGLVVGSLLFVGYSYFKSRSGGDGMTVRFSKQDNI